MYKNTLFNIIGMLIPGLISIPAMAYLARGLNVELFGILMLSFSILGYSGLFDAGITRAVIRKIATQDGLDFDKKIMGTALVSVFFISIIAALGIYVGSSSITSLLNVSSNEVIEVTSSIKCLSIIIPFFLVGTVAFAYLEGKQKFLELNKYKIFTGTIISLFPVVAVFIHNSLFSAIVGLLIARVLVSIVAFYSCYKYLGKGFLCFKWHIFYELITFGGWITLSNIISPLMVYADRFILSNIMGAEKVAFFAAPTDLIQKISIIPGALAKTIFPYFSKNSDDSKKMARQAYISLSIVLFAILVPLFVFSKEILSFWLGSEYGINSTVVLKVLIVGFFFNALAQIPFSRIQALGNSKLTAYIHMAEIIPFFVILFVLVHSFGFVGAAIAWSTRVILDFIVLEYFSRKMH